MAYTNAILGYEGASYEMFWLSQNARHICQNLYAGDRLHDLNHEQIVAVLLRYDYVQEFGNARYVFISRHEQKVYETHIHLEAGRGRHPGRCVIRSCYRSNKQQYIELYKDS